MKHIQTISRNHAPQTANTNIVSIIGTVLSGIGALLLGIVPILSKNAS